MFLIRYLSRFSNPNPNPNTETWSELCHMRKRTTRKRSLAVLPPNLYILPDPYHTCATLNTDKKEREISHCAATSIHYIWSFHIFSYTVSDFCMLGHLEVVSKSNVHKVYCVDSVEA